MSDTNKSESQDWEEFDLESDSERVSPQPGQFTQDWAAIAEKLKLPHQYRKKLPFVNAAPIEEIEAKKLKAAGGKEKKSGRNRHRR
ncbi:hypothetical protein DPMN_092608 [Dreissena polymorpha]|uniref:Uncharacterized protein n=1 Tax=Dreissena polymorpha TaxID=45954 RepID=A0A9D4R157_DREPO|nr:hypothetical protein DPMN_092608 [Dreissena polymorpha]